MNKSDKIYVAGHRGLVGSAIVRSLEAKGYTNIIGRTHKELDLLEQAAVRDFFEKERPDVVVLAAAKVGGINANNTKPAEFAYDNMQVQCNVIKCCHDFEVKKLLFLGSTCIYPRMAPQPIPEDALLTGALEETNEAYAIAKIAGLEMCKFFKRQYGDDFISCMPTNLYGPYDNYDLKDSHVLPAMIRKFHEAKVNGADAVELWGTGSPLRPKPCSASSCHNYAISVHFYPSAPCLSSVHPGRINVLLKPFISQTNAFLQVNLVLPSHIMQLIHIRQLSRRAIRHIFVPQIGGRQDTGGTGGKKYGGLYRLCGCSH